MATASEVTMKPTIIIHSIRLSLSLSSVLLGIATTDLISRDSSREAWHTDTVFLSCD